MTVASTSSDSHNAQSAGHCELFASAAVLLLRVRGVPARYVTGFRGGEWNAVGGYVAVRDDRAHAWAEAFIADRGWVRSLPQGSSTEEVAQAVLHNLDYPLVPPKVVPRTWDDCADDLVSLYQTIVQGKQCGS